MDAVGVPEEGIFLGFLTGKEFIKNNIERFTSKMV